MPVWACFSYSADVPPSVTAAGLHSGSARPGSMPGYPCLPTQATSRRLCPGRGECRTPASNPLMYNSYPADTAQPTAPEPHDTAFLLGY
jgi:hypothetical protein